jgi:uncharacterized hydrophobic protein (TIGR00271 family)
VTALKNRVLPESQRRTDDELTDDLDLSSGDRSAKQSAFWTMLALSGVIATAGVIADSTATVIGAMIIAPLSTPIMGIALGIAKAVPSAAVRSLGFVAAGAVTVVAIGAAVVLIVPGTMDLLANDQVTSRTSPDLVDLLAAIATGFAGAIGLARRDVAAVLPGVAIAISLVPPLAVVGICLGQGAIALALGALVLFLSNLVAMVLSGSLVFAALGFGLLGDPNAARSRRGSYVAVGALMLLVLVPLVGNSAAAYYVAVIDQRVEQVADEWLAGTANSSVESVDFVSNTVTIDVLAPGDLPPTDALLEALRERLPSGIDVVVTTAVGEEIAVGTV